VFLLRNGWLHFNSGILSSHPFREFPNQENVINILKHGETGRKSVAVAGSIVAIDHVTQVDKDSPRVQLHTKFDFANVSQEKILELAAETILIKRRGKAKKANDLGSLEQTFDVVEILSASRTRVSKVDKTEKLLTELSEDDVKSLLAKFQ